MNKIYLEHRDLIRQQAWKFSKRTNLEYEELEAESNLMFCECYDKYDCSRGAFSTYLFATLNNGLKNYSNKIMKQLDTDDYETILTPSQLQDNDKHENFYLLECAVEDMTPDARKIVDLVLSTPEHLYVNNGERDERRITKKNITKYLRKQTPWSFGHINNVYNEISSTINAFQY